MAKAANKLIYGVGINDADYAVRKFLTTGYTKDGKRIQKVVWSCPYFVKWKSMISRCYCLRVKEKYPTYSGCSTIAEWHYFMTFRAWMETQDWEGKELDKDLLVPGNKIYGPDTCIFIDKKVNMFLTERKVSVGRLPAGVNLHKASKKFKAQCGNVSNHKQQHLGLFATPQEAHQAWLSFKLSQAYILAAEQSDPRVAAALIDRYENYAKYFPQPT